jgi:hypothetical protein
MSHDVEIRTVLCSTDELSTPCGLRCGFALSVGDEDLVGAFGSLGVGPVAGAAN